MNRAATAPRRGRPAGLMTARRRQVLMAWAEMGGRGERLSVSRLARECGLYDYRDARRILGDLRRMGKISG